MPAVKRKATLTGLVDSDIEDSQFCEMPTPDSAKENGQPPAKKARGRPKVAPAKVTKAKAPARRTSGRITAIAAATTAKAKPASKEKRLALADKTNQIRDDEKEEVEDLEQDDLSIEKAAPVKGTKAKAAPKKKAAAPKSKVPKEVSIIEATIDEIPPTQEARVTKKGRPSKKTAPLESLPEKIIQETQVEQEMDMDGDVDEEEEEEEEAEKVIIRTAPQIIRPSSNSRSCQTSTHRRPGSASDTERNDPTLRRKLGELTKKYDVLNLKYQDLREIGVKEAEKNFNQLKTRNEAERKASESAIASLSIELESQKALAKESRALKRKLESQATDIGALRQQVEQLTASLSEAQSQNKTLSAKLAANRTAAASVESANAPKVPGSAIKSNSIRMIGSAEAAAAAQAAHLKENIYSDLTGLVVLNVERKAEEDVFDCIQTGRNGTLHFKLAAANEKASESYDDAQCNYVPQLNESRDRDLMELLPEYLVDEITFPRDQAAKFYARVVKALTEKHD